MPTVPEFLLRKLIVKDSFKTDANGFSFAILNSFAPATLLGFSLQVGNQTIPPADLSLQSGSDAPLSGAQISPEAPFALSVGERITVTVRGCQAEQEMLQITVNTREAGALSFSIKAEPPAKKPARRRTTFSLDSLLKRPLKTEVTIDHNDTIGEVNPYIYGQFVEHLERCVYDGIWTADGRALREDSLTLIQALQPPLIRYPGGNFASGYHWEDGIGPREARPQRYDDAWKASESNQVGTDEFLAFCRQVGADPFLVVNDGNGDPEEAARWVAYCNEPPDGEQGRRRAANGHPEPYNVRLWGIGNEVWGQWQIGHTDAETYTARLRRFAEAMRAVDPGIEIVAVGNMVLSDDPAEPGARWNQAVLEGAADLIDHLSFHIYQPDQEGWQEEYDPLDLHHIVCAAPLGVEQIIERISAQIGRLAPEKKIGIALDEWNLWLPPPEGAASMHQVVYTLRDALYAAGMLNVFLRQCQGLQIANLAQLVNVLPLIVTGPDSAYATPLYYSFLLHQQMEPVALRAVTRGKFYDIEALGNIPGLKDVPYVDVAASRSQEGSRLALCIVNRHPSSRTFVDITLQGFEEMQLSEGWLLHHNDPLAYNSLEEPQKVKSRKVDLPKKRGSRFKLDLPPVSVSILALEKES